MLFWSLFPVLRSAHLRVREMEGRAGPFPSFHFMTFGDNRFDGAVRRIRSQAEESGLFLQENIHVYREVPQAIWEQPKWAWHRGMASHVLPEQARAACSPHCGRGHGYWFWKSAIIRSLFDTVIPEGGVLFYADAGCEFGRSDTASDLWAKLLDIQKTSDLVVFGIDHRERRWTKGDIFSAFNTKATDERYGNTSMIAATYFMIKNTAPARAFLAEWENLCSQRKLISDDKSTAANFVKFDENRHDQSLFSMLVKANEPTADRCVQGEPSFPQRGTREKVHGIADLRVELLPDVGYPTSPCNPINAMRNDNATVRLGATCDKSKTQFKALGSRCLLGLDAYNLVYASNT